MDFSGKWPARRRHAAAGFAFKILPAHGFDR